MKKLPSAANFETLRDAIEQRTAKIGIIGLGYVGLPIVRMFVNAGFRTIGYDVDGHKIEQLLAGRSYIKHIASDWIADCIAEKRFHPTAEILQLAEADAILICVPTPLSPERDPDLSFVERTGRQIASVLRPGQMVVLESTTYPTTTRDVLLPILEASGLKCGEEFFLAYSPEREDPGNDKYSTQQIPKVVGGIDATSAKLAEALYKEAVAEVIPVSSSEVAEACKILENTYRAVNIALVNELKVLFDHMGIDIWEVIAAAKTKPFGFQAFYPGPGLGGHCIPIDPFYLSWLARKQGLSTRFIELAGEVNASMPEYVVARITQALNAADRPVKGSRIVILGAAYKRDVDDPRESPAFRIMELLDRLGAVLSYNDPHIPVLPEMRHFSVPKLSSTPLTAAFLASQDCVVIVTDHSNYDWEFVVNNARLVVDTRNATRGVIDEEGRVHRA